MQLYIKTLTFLEDVCLHIFQSSHSILHFIDISNLQQNKWNLCFVVMFCSLVMFLLSCVRSSLLLWLSQSSVQPSAHPSHYWYLNNGTENICSTFAYLPFNHIHASHCIITIIFFLKFYFKLIVLLVGLHMFASVMVFLVLQGQQKWTRKIIITQYNTKYYLLHSLNSHSTCDSNLSHKLHQHLHLLQRHSKNTWRRMCVNPSVCVAKNVCCHEMLGNPCRGCISTKNFLWQGKRSITHHMLMEKNK